MISSNSNHMNTNRETTVRDALSPDNIACLRCIAGHMIPSSDEFAMPGADDEAIISDMMDFPSRDAAELQRVLTLIDIEAAGSLAALPRDQQIACLTRLRGENPGPFVVLEAVVARAYYRDARVLEALGLEPRPPFPGGFEVEQGDFSLLEPVKARGRLYR